MPQRTSKLIRVSVGASYAEILSPNPNRVELLFTGGETITVFVGVGRVAGNDLDVVPVATSNTPLRFTTEMHGDILKKSWWAKSSGGAAALAFVETIEA